MRTLTPILKLIANFKRVEAQLNLHSSNILLSVGHRQALYQFLGKLGKMPVYLPEHAKL